MNYKIALKLTILILILNKICSASVLELSKVSEASKLSETEVLEVEVKAIYNKQFKTLTYEGQVYSLLTIENINDKDNFITKLWNEEISNSEKASSNNIPSSSVKSSDYFFFNVSIIAFLTLFAGAMSGLTVGYLSIDDLVLELKSKTGTDAEKEYAQKILPIISRRHWLLVTLLLCNATAMEALPIFLNRLVEEYMAIIISVTLVLFFGEIIPQALCTGPDQFQIASFLAPLTNLLMHASFPLSYPIALLLDHLVGKHSKSRFVNTDLKGLIELHTMEALEKLSREQGHLMKTSEFGLQNEQADLMISALEISERKSIEIMIPLENVFMLDCDQILDNQNIEVIINKGFSRIPVYSLDRNNVLGILRIKQLIGLDFCQRKSLKQLDIKLSSPLIVHPHTPTLELLHEFKKGKSHMAFITPNVEEYKKKFEAAESENAHKCTISTTYSSKALGIISITKGKFQNEKVLGMVTLEDVLEKMINIEILDEDDYARNKILHEKANAAAKNKFYKKAITKELARSLLEDNTHRLSSIIENSFRPRNLLLDKSNYDSDNDKLKEPLL